MNELVNTLADTCVRQYSCLVSCWYWIRRAQLKDGVPCGESVYTGSQGQWGACLLISHDILLLSDIQRSRINAWVNSQMASSICMTVLVLMPCRVQNILNSMQWKVPKLPAYIPGLFLIFVLVTESPERLCFMLDSMLRRWWYINVGSSPNNCLQKGYAQLFIAGLW